MTRYFVSINSSSARFITASDQSIQFRRIEALHGVVTSEDSAYEMPAAEIAAQLEQAPRHGYREVDKLEFEELQVQVDVEFERMIVEAVSPGGKFVVWSELAADHEAYFHNNPAEYLVPNLRKFCVFDQPHHASSDVVLKFDSLGPTEQTNSRNLIFNQGLAIDGNLDAGGCTSELPLLVIVKGDLHAKNLILTGWVEVIVTGDLVVAGTVFGFDGEAGGRLHVNGNLHAPRVLGGMMFNIEVDGEVHSDVYWTDDDEPTLPNASTVPNSLSQEQARDLVNQTPLVQEAYFVETNWATGEAVQTLNFDSNQVVELIRNGSPLFRAT